MNTAVGVKALTAFSFLRVLAPYNAAPMKAAVAHAELIATYQRAKADAAHKIGLISAVSKKGPKAIQAAVDTAARAEKRRDSFAKKLRALEVVVED
jgi:enoyl-CoA hydratase/carnithine racemase